ncbi:hypothetical protein GCM10012288_09500 [Malaciobacter pacificus]|uniref:Energy transduction protein TonB n=1 Tax=Malaciobacter pacificus TaxID=1080223 RepID=A0A5C2HE19_9BACT|nr:energy transducer TonB [Malaciobacter pacificus]QEP34602.1 energy transduction protein TonB [Malaciobacter pacificus]GGD37455.1 hypothetical protein GCM10012288_09500 [Malaciobacter pacificus]
MKRYFGSFFLTLFIYLSAATTLFYVYSNSEFNKEKIEEPVKKISLNHVEIKPIIKKELPKKEEIKKVQEKIIKKEVVKKQIKPKVKPKPKAKKVVKKTIKKEIRKQEVQKPVKKVVKEETITTPKPVISKKAINTVPKVNAKQEFLNKHLSQIRNLINENIKYPKRARKLKIQGLVTVKFKILKDGKLGEIQIIDGNKFLRKSTIEAIKRAANNFPKTTTDIEIKIPIAYKLI